MKEEKVNSSFCLLFEGNLGLFPLYLTSEIQCSQKTKNLLWNCMPTCLLHRKPDVPSKTSVLTVKIGTLFLKRLI